MKEKEKMKKKLFSLLLAASMLTTVLAGCGNTAGGNTPASPAASNTDVVDNTGDNGDADVVAPVEGVGKVGVAMPTKDLQRWNQDGENMKAALEAAGYEVDLQYASNDIATQVSQIENMISSGAQVLVIASIDGDSLGTVLAQAKEAGIKVIAYDRLIMNSDAVSYYATFDNYMVEQSRASTSSSSLTSTMQQVLSTWKSSLVTLVTTTQDSSMAVLSTFLSLTSIRARS